MTAIQANGITIEYETTGSLDDPAMLLVMGHNSQLVVWPEDFRAQLAAKGFYVIAYDNRDVGKSTWFPAGTQYSVSDMAADGMELLSALGIESAHIAGASLGGGIVQYMAIEHPHRVRSMCSIMSTTSAPGLPGPPPELAAKAMELMMNPPQDRDGIIEQSVPKAHIVGSTGFEIDDDAVRALAALTYDRGYNPDGGVNQSMAVAAAYDRTEDLGKLTMPCVVIHGTVDPLVHPLGGEWTAKAIPGAELVMIEGMGHDLPRGAWPIVIDAIVRNARRASQ
jgi:pimeloyl-ACP methyl ester carboxylesterase